MSGKSAVVSASHAAWLGLLSMLLFWGADASTANGNYYAATQLSAAHGNAALCLW